MPSAASFRSRISLHTGLSARSSSPCLNGSSPSCRPTACSSSLAARSSAQPLDLVPLILVTTVASTLSAICWYGIGHALGEERTHNLVKRYGRYVGLKEAVYLSLAGRYTRNAFIATFMGQTIPVVRCYLSLARRHSRPAARHLLAGRIDRQFALGRRLHVHGLRAACPRLGSPRRDALRRGGSARRSRAASPGCWPSAARAPRIDKRRRPGAVLTRFVRMSQNRSGFPPKFRASFETSRINAFLTAVTISLRWGRLRPATVRRMLKGTRWTDRPVPPRRQTLPIFSSSCSPTRARRRTPIADRSSWATASPSCATSSISPTSSIS